jgi:hypothetical protein
VIAGGTSGLAAATARRRRGPHALETFARVIAISLIGTLNALRLTANAMLAKPQPGTGAAYA